MKEKRNNYYIAHKKISKILDKIKKDKCKESKFKKLLQNLYLDKEIHLKEYDMNENMIFDMDKIKYIFNKKKYITLILNKISGNVYIGYNSCKVKKNQFITKHIYFKYNNGQIDKIFRSRKTVFSMCDLNRIFVTKISKFPGYELGKTIANKTVVSQNENSFVLVGNGSTRITDNYHSEIIEKVEKIDENLIEKLIFIDRKCVEKRIGIPIIEFD